jgi:hypothetical protein
MEEELGFAGKEQSVPSSRRQPLTSRIRFALMILSCTWHANSQVIGHLCLDGTALHPLDTLETRQRHADAAFGANPPSKEGS